MFSSTGSPAGLGEDYAVSRLFHPINKDILRVLNACLSINVKAFHSSEMRQQWKAVYGKFSYI